MSNEQEKKPELTDEEKAQCGTLENPQYAHLGANKIADMRKRGLLSESAFTDVYKIICDPNKTKDGTKYRSLLTAITNGNLPDRAISSTGKTTSIISILIHDLEAGYKPAEELINKLKIQANSPFSKYAERSYLKEKAENEKKESLGVTELIAKTHDRSAEKGATKEKDSNWKAEKLSEERKKEMTELLKISTELLRTLNKKYEEFKDNPNSLLELEIKELEAKLADMEALFDKRDLPYFESNVNRFRKLSAMTKYLGIDLNYVKKLKLKSGKYIYIEKIFFEDPEELNYSGALYIKFKDENGRESTMNFLVFVKNILGEKGIGEGAYQEMNSIKELDENIAELSGYKGLEIGDEFCAKEYIEGEDGRKEVDIEFKILEIKDDGDEGIVKLSGDHEDMNFGQFSKFLFRFGYQRKFKDKEDEQRAMDGAAAARNKRLVEMENEMPDDWKILGEQAEDPVKIPDEGESTKIIKDGLPANLERTDDGLKIIERPLIATGDADNPFREGKEKITDISPEDLAREVNRGNIGGATVGPSKEGDEEAPAKFATEALPFSEVDKVGGMTTEEKGYLSSLYAESYFLSGSDVWEMLKTMWDYYKRRQERRQKERFATVAKDIPWFAPEMRRIKQAAENEQMGQFKEELDQAGIDEVREELRTTTNRDRLKACFAVLSQKGQMDWKDIDMWKNLNTFVSPDKYIPIPSNGDPETRVSDTDSRAGFDFLQPAIDSLWGNGGFNDWYSQNKGAYQSGIQKFYEKGNEMENKDASFDKVLEKLLYKHKNGEYVDPHEYEALLTYMIDFGKGDMPSKIFYMVEGMTARNSDGKTIMSFDRMSHMNAKLMAKFPLMDYMVAKVMRSDGVKSRFKIDDYRKWSDMFNGENKMNCKVTKQVEDFLWDTILQSEPTKIRIDKAIREGQNIDHDDSYAFIPLLSSTGIDSVCKAVGGKIFFSTPGYKNIFSGMSHFMLSLTRTGNANKLKELIKSYVRYDASMTNRWHKGKPEYQRLGFEELNSKIGVAPDHTPQYFIDELREVVNKVVAAYSGQIPGLKEAGELIFEETPGESIRDDNRKEQEKIQAALENFDNIMDKVMVFDGGQKMMAVVAGSKLTGMQMYK